MNYLLKSIRSEFYKSRRTFAVAATLIVPFAPCVIAFLVFYHESSRFVGSGINPWHLLGNMVLSVTGSFLLPLYILMITYSINNTEYRAGGWKIMFTLPYPRHIFYLSKVLFGILLLVICLALVCLLMLLTAGLLSKVKPGLNFQDYESAGLIIITVIKFWITSLAIFSIQFFLCTVWNDFVRPGGIGLLGMLAGLMIARQKYGIILPYTYPMRVMEQFRAESMDILTTESLLSITIFILLIFFGGKIVNRKLLK